MHKSDEILMQLKDENEQEVETVELATDYINTGDYIMHKDVEYLVTKKTHNTSAGFTLVIAVDSEYFKKLQYLKVGEAPSDKKSEEENK